MYFLPARIFTGDLSHAVFQPFFVVLGIVLDHGRIVERGSHSQLLEADGVYAQMWQRQQARKDSAPGSPPASDDVGIRSALA